MESAIRSEPLASSDTALSCLAWLCAANGGDADAEELRRRGGVASDHISVPRLIALAGQCGLTCGAARLDWSTLQARGFASPLLVVLKNRNVVIVTGGGRGDAEEVAVWDPLHRDADGEGLFVPREVFERAWGCLLYTSPSPRDLSTCRMPSSA